MTAKAWSDGNDPAAGTRDALGARWSAGLQQVAALAAPLDRTLRLVM